MAADDMKRLGTIVRRVQCARERRLVFGQKLMSPRQKRVAGIAIVRGRAGHARKIIAEGIEITLPPELTNKMAWANR